MYWQFSQIVKEKEKMIPEEKAAVDIPESVKEPQPVPDENSKTAAQPAKKESPIIGKIE